ncbi:MAG: DUF309 domain-containing protein [Gemmataceae bacterium]|nr:DUF309 domain-containing protein [Gemmataceae bacterium]
MPPDRLLTNWPFPAYAHVPGKTPHPHSDPKGHRHPTPDVEPSDAELWRRCPAYLHGIDLFDAGYYWEAHEAWEQLWHAVGRRGPDAEFVKGLIQLAVAGVKHRQAMPESMRWHAKRATELLPACRKPIYRGIMVDVLIAGAMDVAAGDWPATWLLPIVGNLAT